MLQTLLKFSPALLLWLPQSLLAAEKIDPKTLDGSIYTSFGSLYFKVPGWPISFGDKKKARKMLIKATTMNPTGIDPNYFYAEFLYEEDEYQLAKKYIEIAAKAPSRKSRPIADAGRRAEIKILLKKIKLEL